MRPRIPSSKLQLWGRFFWSIRGPLFGVYQVLFSSAVSYVTTIKAAPVSGSVFTGTPAPCKAAPALVAAACPGRSFVMKRVRGPIRACREDVRWPKVRRSVRRVIRAAARSIRAPLRARRPPGRSLNRCALNLRTGDVDQKARQRLHHSDRSKQFLLLPIGDPFTNATHRAQLLVGAFDHAACLSE